MLFNSQGPCRADEHRASQAATLDCRHVCHCLTTTGLSATEAYQIVFKASGCCSLRSTVAFE